jgi:microcompartment protein CcmK/EutM
MILARVDGVIVSTVCHPSLTGSRTVICQPLDGQGREEGPPILAIDPLSAGLHERVLILADGPKAREFVKDAKSPLRNIILALVDEPVKETA